MSTKRQVQLTGVRKWFGSDTVTLQNSIYEHFENLFLRYGIGQILIKAPTFDNNNNVTDIGYVLMNGSDGYRICEISGSYTGSTGDAVYLKQDFVTVDQDVYTDSGSTKDITRKYIAADQGTSQPASPWIRLQYGTLYDESGNELMILTDWLEDKFYTKVKANDNTQNSIDASKILGQDIEQWKNVSLDSEYSNLGGYPLSYRKNITKNVEIRGAIIGDGSPGTLIGTLPPNYRPFESQFFMVHLGNMISNDDYERIEIKPDGTINCIGSLSVNQYTYFNITILL